MASADRVESQDAAVLEGLSSDQREKLRRIVLVSTEDDWTISQQVQCNPMHVQAMRRRLRMLGVLPQVVDEVKPRTRRPTDCRCEPGERKWNEKTRTCGKCGKRYSKYVNAEIFEGSHE